MLLKKKELNREEYITGLLGVTTMEGYIMAGDSSRQPFEFEMTVPS